MQSKNIIPHLSLFHNDGIPAGLIVVALDENITILEANNGYFNIIGYTREEVRDLFDNKGLNTIHKDDIPLAFSTIKDIVVNNLRNISIRIRLINKQDKYRTIHTTAYSEFKDGQVYLHLLLLDLSKHYELFEQIKDKHDFNNIVDSLTDDSYFDYNIKEKTIRFSPALSEKFSLPAVVNNYPQTLIEKKLISDDFIILNDNYIEIEFEKELYTNTVTFTHNNEEFYFDITYKTEKNKENDIVRVIGKMNDVTKKYLQIENLTLISQVDQLTGLYNKSTTERLITNTIRNRRVHDGIYALFMIDADNFKSINDTFGHLYGDIVLTQLANHLKSLFRANDIIGRIGGDEFIVLLRDYKSLDLIIKKAKEICFLFNKVYTEDTQSVQMTASIGISLFPEHGTTFNELYHNADIALYNVKKSGKNNYEVYNGYQNEQHIPRRTELDETTLKKDFKENQFEYIFKLLHSFKDSISAVKAVLPLIMDQYNFNRTFYFESYNQDEVINSFAISNDNSHEELIQFVFNKKDYSSQVKDAAKKGYYYRDKNTKMKLAQKHPIFSKVSTLFLYPIMFENQTLGVIGFDANSQNHLLTDENLEKLVTVTGIISTFLAKELALKRAKTNEELILSILDELDSKPIESIKSQIKEFLK